MVSDLMGHTISSFRSILRSFYHWRQLQVLVVLVVTFLPSIPLPSSNDLLIELNHMVHSLVGWRVVLATLAFRSNSLLLTWMTMAAALLISLHHHALMTVSHSVPRMTLSLTQVDRVKVV